MYSKSYPIWNKVEACIYKSSKSFGAVDTSAISINVGSAYDSHPLCKIVTTRRKVENHIVFRFSVDGRVLRHAVFQYNPDANSGVGEFISMGDGDINILNLNSCLTT